MTSEQNICTKGLILVPAIISLAVTIIRLVGELVGGSQFLFGSAAGGGMSLIGIVWLVPIFGIYFAWKLLKAGKTPASAGKLIGWALLAMVLTIGVFALLPIVGISELTSILIGSFISLGLCFLVKRGWKELFSTLFAYGMAARIPVAIVMLIAIMGDWGTHYDVPPSADFPEMGVFLKWVVIGLIPQLTVWIAFTVAVGAIFGGLTVLFVKKTG